MTTITFGMHHFFQQWLRDVEDVPVLYEVLHVQVIDEQRVSQVGIAHCLVQWESWFTQREMINPIKLQAKLLPKRGMLVPKRGK